MNTLFRFCSAHYLYLISRVVFKLQIRESLQLSPASSLRDFVTITGLQLPGFFNHHRLAASGILKSSQAAASRILQHHRLQTSGNLQPSQEASLRAFATVHDLKAKRDLKIKRQAHETSD
jgi:hypothetical protein